MQFRALEITPPLGTPLPVGNKHAVSVSMPQWDDVVRYEEQDPDTIAALQTGYPRFVLHPLVLEYFQFVKTELKVNAKKRLFVFPNEQAASGAAEYLLRYGGMCESIRHVGLRDHTAVITDVAGESLLKQYWQHTGQVISSRAAADALDGNLRGMLSPVDARLAAAISEYVGVRSDAITLYPSGMTAMHAVLTVVNKLYPHRKSVQYGFAYVDALKLQERVGPGMILIAGGREEQQHEIEKILRKEQVSAIFVEFPSNPLLECHDLERLRHLATKHEVPLIIDETLGSFYNVDILRFADALWTSLTKYFSGVGDVMAGSLIVNPETKLGRVLLEQIKHSFESQLYIADADCLLQNSIAYESRMQCINANAAAVVDYLKLQPEISQLNYPSLKGVEIFDSVRRRDGGYGGLLSVVLRDTSQTQKFYDALQLAKGPNLGTEFTLVCPYTLLAHYQELDVVERLGINPYLLRMSVGCEPEDRIIDSLGRAFSAIRHPSQ